MPEEQALIELTWPDWVVVGVYMVSMFGIAYWAMRKIKDAGGFLLGKRKVGLWMLMGTGFDNPRQASAGCSQRMPWPLRVNINS